MSNYAKVKAEIEIKSKFNGGIIFKQIFYEQNFVKLDAELC